MDIAARLTRAEFRLSLTIRINADNQEAGDDGLLVLVTERLVQSQAIPLWFFFCAVVFVLFIPHLCNHDAMAGRGSALSRCWPALPSISG
jgi:hypothetical protein